MNSNKGYPITYSPSFSNNTIYSNNFVKKTEESLTHRPNMVRPLSIENNSQQSLLLHSRNVQMRSYSTNNLSNLVPQQNYYLNSH